MDEFVMMRLAEMIDEGLVSQAIDSAIERGGGNVGCERLRSNAEKLKAALAEIKLDKPEWKT